MREIKTVAIGLACISIGLVVFFFLILKTYPIYFSIIQTNTDHSIVMLEYTKIFFTLLPPLLTGTLTAVTALILFQYGTKKIDEKKELIDFHKKYIDLKNEFSKCLIEISFQGTDLEKKKNNLLQLSFLFSKSINLIFEECLSAEHNSQVRKKLERDEIKSDSTNTEGWVKSTSEELAHIIFSIEKIYASTTPLKLQKSINTDLKNLIKGIIAKNSSQLQLHKQHDNKKRSRLQLEIFFDIQIKLNKTKNRRTSFAKDIFKLQTIYQRKFAKIANGIVIQPQNKMDLKEISTNLKDINSEMKSINKHLANKNAIDAKGGGQNDTTAAFASGTK